MPCYELSGRMATTPYCTDFSHYMCTLFSASDQKEMKSVSHRRPLLKVTIQQVMHIWIHVRGTDVGIAIQIGLSIEVLIG